MHFGILSVGLEHVHSSEIIDGSLTVSLSLSLSHTLFSKSFADSGYFQVGPFSTPNPTLRISWLNRIIHMQSAASWSPCTVSILNWKLFRANFPIYSVSREVTFT